LKKLIELINEYKNVRSHLEELSITINQGSFIYKTAGNSMDADLDGFLLIDSNTYVSTGSVIDLEV